MRVTCPTLVALAICAAPLQAQARLVRNINQQVTFPQSSSPEKFQKLGGLAIFIARSESGFGQFQELWRSDGTDAGTFRLSGDCHPDCFRAPRFIGNDDHLLYFFAFSDRLGLGLYRTDGSVAGTVLLADGLSSPATFAFPGTLLAPGGPLLFTARDAAHGSELWRSDGTPAGTVLVKDIAPGTANGLPGTSVLLGGIAYFSAFEPGSGREIWRTDGTAAGTHLVFDPTPGPVSSLAGDLRVVDGHLIFTTATSAGVELWETDGTAAGTLRLKVLSSLFDPQNPELATGSAGGRVFLALPDEAGVLQLWVTDGTAAGTRQLTSFTDPAATLLEEGKTFVNLEGRAYFLVRDPALGDEPWTSDGTPQGTHLLLDICPGACSSGARAMRRAPGGVHFTAGDPEHGTELWRTDGTPGGTRRILDLCPGPCSSFPFGGYVLAGADYIAATDDVHGYELWETDGTAAGTVRLTDLSPEQPFSQLFMVDLGSDVLFAADDGVHGQELWHTDGTPEGTGLLSDIATQFDDGSHPNRLTVFRGAVYFLADNGVTGPALWRSDGSTVGTQRVRSLPSEGLPARPGEPPELVTAAGRLFFLIGDLGQGESVDLWASDGTATGTVPLVTLNTTGLSPEKLHLHGAASQVFLLTGHGLWRSDGTPAGTSRLAVLSRNTFSAGAVVGDTLLFPAAGGVDGTDEELWRSDGTTTGTFEVQDIWPGPQGSRPADLTAVRDLVYFSADDPDSGRQLWRSDGTAAGTEQVDVFPSSSEPSSPVSLSALGNRLLFFSDLEGGMHTSELHLYSTDGTATGTRELAEVRPPELSGDPSSAVASGLLYFLTRAPAEALPELWRSDGTPGGTGPIALLPAESSPWSLWETDGTLVISALANNGDEVWLSRGTPQTTRLAATFPMHLAGRAPGEFTQLGETTLFRATGRDVGDELWALDRVGEPPAPACRPGPEVLCLGGGRYRVAVTWHDQHNGGDGVGHAVPLPRSDESGLFWFFDPQNIELIVKLLDGTSINNAHWVFYGALSDVAYRITVTDVATQRTRIYDNPPGTICGRGDTAAFPNVASLGATPGGPGQPASRRTPPPPRRPASRAREACVRDGGTLCLGPGGRLAVTVTWHDQHNGGDGIGHAVVGSPDSGFFWFFNRENLELVVKVLDGRPLNGHFWVFSGALSDVEYDIRVRDTVDGRELVLHNAAGGLCGHAEIGVL